MTKPHRYAKGRDGQVGHTNQLPQCYAKGRDGQVGHTNQLPQCYAVGRYGHRVLQSQIRTNIKLTLKLSQDDAQWRILHNVIFVAMVPQLYHYKHGRYRCKG